VIEQAYKNGARFDSWREFFDYSVWKQSAEQVGYDWYKPINGYEVESALPWDNISIGITKEFLVEEYRKAKSATITKDCKTDVCTNCGVCVSPSQGTKRVDGLSLRGSVTEQADTISDFSASVPHLYRIFFSKLNDLKFLSHLDFLRLVHRLLMLSGLPIVFSQGFSPHPKTAFCPPLSSGIEGECEFFDVYLSEFCDENFILYSLTNVRIEDLYFTRAILLSEANHVPIGQFDVESLVVEFLDCGEHIQKLNDFLLSDDTTITKERKGKIKQTDLKDIILDINWKDDRLLILKKIQGASVFDILNKVFGIKREEAGAYRIVRKEMFCS
jgi:radical SAM-linked protein